MDGYKAYGRSKLCNILFTRALARRLAGSGVTANCLHPGFVATRFGDQAGGWMSLAIRAAKLFAISPDKGAETIVYLATSPEVASQEPASISTRTPRTHRRPRLRMMPSPTGSGRNRPGSRGSTSSEVAAVGYSGSGLPACSLTMYSAYQSGQLVSY